MRVLPLCCLLVAPLAAQQSPAAAARELVLERAQAASEASYATGIATALPVYLSIDAAVLWPGAGVLRGSTQVGRFFAAQTSLEGARITWQAMHLEISDDATLALMWGAAVVDRPTLGKVPATHRIARFLAAWQPVSGEWRIAALAFAGLLNGAETVWNDSLGERELPMLPSTGVGGAFIAADSAFAAEAARAGAQRAFTHWAAADAVTFSGTGELSIGRDAIGRGFEGDANQWSWGAVAAGASADGSLGWTAGQAVIAGKQRTSKSKYLTLWRREKDGSVHFLSDGGNGRP
ncbi:MAG: hypothetical protein V4503_12005 [Gemmatimonadota bacterium]